MDLLSWTPGVGAPGDSCVALQLVSDPLEMGAFPGCFARDSSTPFFCPLLLQMKELAHIEVELVVAQGPTMN